MTQEDRALFEITRCKEGFTLKERVSGQQMHSQVGPQAEANEVYVAQSSLERRLQTIKDVQQTPLVLYDVGMGTAANAIAVIQKYRALGFSRRLEIISFENKPTALEFALEASAEFPFLVEFRDALKALIKTGSVQLEPQIRWRLESRDFRDADLSRFPPAELIYFDFYTPASCPELWTEEVFKKLLKKSKNSLLITYSAAKSVRSAMLLAGLYVGAGRSTDLKLETTLAATRLEDLEKPLDAHWLKSLERSGKPFPLGVSPDAYAEAFQILKKHPQFI
jgi:tRNA U34 5-methylaminomethyl-2-thiouridine-forming methyltransferase MnmC